MSRVDGVAEWIGFCLTTGAFALIGTKVTPAARCQAIGDVRREIDRIDRTLVALLAERMTYIRRAGQLKTDRGRIRDQARLAAVVAKVRDEARKNGLEPSLIEQLWRELMRLSIAYEFTVYDAKERA